MASAAASSVISVRAATHVVAPFPAANAATDRVALARPSARAPARKVCLHNSTFAGAALQIKNCKSKRLSRDFSTVAKAANEQQEEVKLLPVTITEKAVGDSKVEITITIAVAEVTTIYDFVVAEYCKYTSVPGWRKGRAVPKEIVIQKVGAKKIATSTIEELLQRSIKNGVEKMSKTPLAGTERITSRIDDLVANFYKDRPFSYTVALDIYPTVTWKSPDAYKKLAVTVETLSPSALQAKVDAFIQSRRKELGKLSVKLGAVEMGDVVIADYSAKRVDPKDGSANEEIFGASGKGTQLDTTDTTLLPGMVSSILGMTRGETRTFDVIFPMDWEPASLRGSAGRFSLTVKELFSSQLPELNDAIAQKLAVGCNTMEEVYKVLAKEQAEETDKVVQTNLADALTAALGEVCITEVPDSLVQEQGRLIYSTKLLELQTAGQLSYEQLKSFSSETMVADYISKNREELAKSVKRSMASHQLFVQEGMSISEEEIQAEMGPAVAEFKRMGQEYDPERLREQVTEVLEGQKVVEFLKANSKITYKTVD